MLIPLTQIEEEPFSWRERISIPVESLNREELVGLGQIACRGQIRAVSAGFLLEANLSYQQTLACVRCLEPIDEPVDARVELIIAVRASPPAVGELELSETDLYTLYVDEEQLDTRPMLLEQVQLNIPMRAICREDCAGLCRVCGLNRNHGSCDCDDGPTDPRWEALRQWSRKN